jgi:hypothetical protein
MLLFSTARGFCRLPADRARPGPRCFSRRVGRLFVPAPACLHQDGRHGCRGRRRQLWLLDSDDDRRLWCGPGPDIFRYHGGSGREVGRQPGIFYAARLQQLRDARREDEADENTDREMRCDRRRRVIRPSPPIALAHPMPISPLSRLPDDSHAPSTLPLLLLVGEPEHTLASNFDRLSQRAISTSCILFIRSHRSRFDSIVSRPSRS